MASRLHKEINRQRRVAYRIALENWQKNNSNDDCTCISDCSPGGGNLPYPTKIVFRGWPAKKAMNGQPTQTIGSGPLIQSPYGTNSYHEDKWAMVQKHCLWIRLFDKNDELLFNHASAQYMYASQMIQICTKLVNHLNLISRTNELNVQKALGTIESTIIAQLALPLEESAQYHEWKAQEQRNSHYLGDIGAIAIIHQKKDNVFKGQLTDDYVGITFQI